MCPVQLASERDPRRVLEIIRKNSRPDQTVFVGVIDPIDPAVETPEQVCDRVLLAAEHVPVERLGTCDGAAGEPGDPGVVVRPAGQRVGGVQPELGARGAATGDQPGEVAA
jgi:hypothetical protein